MARRPSTLRALRNRFALILALSKPCVPTLEFRSLLRLQRQVDAFLKSGAQPAPDAVEVLRAVQRFDEFEQEFQRDGFPRAAFQAVVLAYRTLIR